MCACAQNVQLPFAPDALLFSFSHDVLQSPAAIRNVLVQTKPDGRVVTVGKHLVPPRGARLRHDLPWVPTPSSNWLTTALVTGERTILC